jgi:hypothetical protein
LELKLDALFHGAMSFYIARYQEGRTWPDGFDLEEPPYTEFFLSDRPRLDVQFRWFDRVERLQPQLDGTDLKDLPVTFMLEFDGGEFKPKGEFNLAQTFEIPNLEEMEKQGSRFRLIAHDPAQKQAREIAADTDLNIRLSGGAGDGGLCLYASRTTPAQRIILGSEFLGHVKSPIRRTVLLQEYARAAPREDRRPEILAALEKGEFESEEQRRLGAQFRHSEAILARFRALHRDAYVKFQEAAELMQPLVLEQKPSLPDATLMYRACRAMVEVWLRQQSYPQAAQIGETLGSIARAIRDSDAENPDFQRIWADAVRLNAGIHARLGDEQRAAGELRENVDTLLRLSAALPSQARRIAYLAALTDAVQSAADWKIEKAVPVKQWKDTLAAEVGDSTAAKLLRPRPAVPRWLEPCDPAGLPTVPLESATLRYSLRIPNRWGTDPEIRGTAREVEHIYRGTRDSEWLIITFMEKANDTSDMTNWVETFIAMSGFPVLLDFDAMPKLTSWNYLGKVPGLAKKLAVDEAHAYTGLAQYSRKQGRPVLGRLYVVMARRKSFAWKLALSIETACFEGMPEEKVYSQDHMRAGAILGKLRLGGPRRSKETPR